MKVQLPKVNGHRVLKQKNESENERNSEHFKETTARQTTKDSHESKLVITNDSQKKQMVTSSTTSSTEASSVVRTLVERGCQSQNNETVIKVTTLSVHHYLFMDNNII